MAVGLLDYSVEDHPNVGRNVRPLGVVPQRRRFCRVTELCSLTACWLGPLTSRYGRSHRPEGRASDRNGTVPMTFRHPTESPAESAAYWRRLRPQGTFVLVVATVLFFPIAGMPWWWVAIATALSAFSGIPAFIVWITERRWGRGLAALGGSLRPRLTTLGLAFGTTILLQGIVGMTLGAWPATAFAPVAFAIEFLTAREHLRRRTADKGKR